MLITYTHLYRALVLRLSIYMLHMMTLVMSSCTNQHMMALVVSSCMNQHKELRTKRNWGRVTNNQKNNQSNFQNTLV
jgi:hypothetical protein